MVDIGLLLSRIANGDRLAFEILLTTVQARFLSVAEAIIGDRTGAEDAVQETFIRVLRFAADADAGRDPKAWLFRICVNCARDVRAGTSRHRAAPLPESGWADEGTTPLGDLLARERREAVARGLNDLREDLREVLLLRFTADLSYAQIARVQEVPIGTVKSRMHTALRQLGRIVASRVQ